MGGIAAQRKGKRGEEELAAILQEYGYPARRGAPLNYGTEPDISGLPGVHIEVKRTERLNLSAALEQSKKDALRFQDGLPVVIHRANRQKWRVTMDLETFISIYRKAERKSNQ